MSDFSTALQSIQTAVLGDDVRDAFCEALTICFNKENTDAQTLNGHSAAEFITYDEVEAIAEGLDAEYSERLDDIIGGDFSGTVPEKFNKVDYIKDDIKDALEFKGQTVTDETPFDAYPEKIRRIESGSSNLGELIATEDGTYDAVDEGLDGYSTVTVSVGGGGGAENYIRLLEGDPTLSKFVDDKLTTIGAGAFAMKELEEAEFHNLHAGSGQVGNMAFYSCQTLKKVIFDPIEIDPESSSPYSDCLTLNTNAFAFCYSLSSIVLDENCKFNIIGSGVFNGCSSLRSFEFSRIKGLYNAFAFAYCNGFSSIDFCVDSGALSLYQYGSKSYYSIVGNPISTFANCANLSTVNFIYDSSSADPQIEVTPAYMFANCSRLNSLSMPGIKVIGPWFMSGWYSNGIVRIDANHGFGNVEYFASSAFCYCSWILGLSLAQSIYSIDYSAFYGCSNLSSVVLPNVENIGWGAFSYCGSLKYVSVGANIIGSYAFAYASRLTNFIFGKAKSQDTYIENSAFYYCSSLTTLSYNSTFTVSSTFIKKIGDYAFCGCSRLTNIICMSKTNSITDPADLTRICSSAFQGCNNLQYIRGDIGYVGDYAFNYISYNFSSISLWYCSYIGSYAFAYCSKLSSTTAGNLTKCEFLGNNAFNGCSLITSVNVPVLETVNSWAFNYCISLQSISAPSLKTLCSWGFAACSVLTDVYVPLLEDVGSNAFNYDTSLSVISLPMCNHIGSAAFFGCSNLASVYIDAESVPILDSSDAFNLSGYNSSATVADLKIYVPSSLYDAYLSADNWSMISSYILSH